MKIKLITISLFSLFLCLFGAKALAASALDIVSTGITILPVGPVNVAPHQPEVLPNSTRGIINALCDVKLNIVSCPFLPNAGVITCDSNGDGVDEVSIQLKDITIINSLLVQMTIPSLPPHLSGTAFPLACCGGEASITLLKKVGDGDDNIFGEYTLKTTCPIDLGVRAPVVISASPSAGNCAIGQNLQIPGSCFTLPFTVSTNAEGEPVYLPGTTKNVDAVYAVEVGNPSNVIQAKTFVILTHNMIDAFFEFGDANAGKTFLIYVTGPNGTSRNLTVRPQGTPASCPLGNEQGIQVTFSCDKKPTSGGDSAPVSFPAAQVLNCKLERNEAGAFSLTITGKRISPDAKITVGGVIPKKMKVKTQDTENSGFFTKAILKGRFCNGLPGVIFIENPGERSSQAFQCAETCNVP
jgi:hypothetical protein